MVNFSSIAMLVLPEDNGITLLQNKKVMVPSNPPRGLCQGFPDVQPEASAEREPVVQLATTWDNSLDQILSNAWDPGMVYLPTFSLRIHGTYKGKYA